MLSKTDLDKYRAEHPRGIVHLIGKAQTWECVFQIPTRNEYKMFRANSHNPSRVADANDTLAIQTVLYPEREAFQALLETYPAIPEAFSSNDELKALVGMTTEEGAKI